VAAPFSHQNISASPKRQAAIMEYDSIGEIHPQMNVPSIALRRDLPTSSTREHQGKNTKLKFRNCAAIYALIVSGKTGSFLPH
jgi:hypothetical protein